MRIVDLEAWLLNIVDLVDHGQKVEDSRVELKATWPMEHRKAARRIAGHLNASRGSDVLWIIGVDEASGVVGVNPDDYADWWPKVARCFDELAPTVRELNVPVAGHQAVAMLFGGDRVPYVIKTTGNGPDREVPWREATSVRTATRSDLVRILVPVSRRPVLELHSIDIGQLRAPRGSDSKSTLEAWIYAMPVTDARLILPWHHARIDLLTKTNTVEDISVAPMRAPDAALVAATKRGDIVINGPGVFRVGAELPRIEFKDQMDAVFRFRAASAGSDLEVTLEQHVTLRKVGHRLKWELTDRPNVVLF